MVLAQAADPNTLAGLTVMEWTLLLTTIGAGLAFFLKWLEARASKREAHELALAKIEAEKERDAAFVGVERAGDARTKMEIREAAGEAGLNSDAFAAKVRKATSRLVPVILALAFLGALSGCCAVDHERMAQNARISHEALSDALSLSDADISPSFARSLIQKEMDGWEAIHAELTGAPITSATRARIEGGPR